VRHDHSAAAVSVQAQGIHGITAQCQSKAVASARKNIMVSGLSTNLCLSLNVADYIPCIISCLRVLTRGTSSGQELPNPALAPSHTDLRARTGGRGLSGP
jgi:hypothetical protein